MAPIALSFAVLEQSGKIGDLGAVLAMRTIPMIVFLLLGGVLADRMSRTFLLQTSNLGAALSQGFAAYLLIADEYRLERMLILQFVNGVLVAFSLPALRGVVPQIVAKGEMQAANSALAVAGKAIAIAGPAIGGIVAATVGGGWAIAIDAVSFLVAAICMRQVRLGSTPHPAKSGIFSDLKDGWTHFRSFPWLWSIVAAFALMNATQAGAWYMLGPAIAQVSFGAAGWGLVLSFQTLGALLATLVLFRLRVPRLLLLGQGLISLAGIPMIVLGSGFGLYWLLGAALVAGIGSGTFGVAWETSLQQQVPNHLLSRVASYDDLGSLVAIPLGQMCIAPMAAWFGTPQVALACGAVYFLVAITPILCIPSVRRLPNLGHS